MASLNVATITLTSSPSPEAKFVRRRLTVWEPAWV
jgi:hypothetical protein